MKKALGMFVTGAVVGFSIPWFFGTLSRMGKPKQSQAAKEKKQESIGIDPRFDFPRPTYNYRADSKLVLGIRMDLEHDVPHLASLVGDMAIKAVVNAYQINPNDVLQWLHYGQAKITTKVPDLNKMNELKQKCTDAKIPYAIIEENNTPVIIGIGPGPVGPITQVSGDLKLI